MRTRIIWRNAKHSAKDYLLYQLTMLLSLSLVYAFNLLVFSDEIKQLSGEMSIMTVVVVGISFIVVWVIGWLVYYMSRFMLEKRSREFGTYLLLGVSNKTVASVFVKENMLMGGIAFAASLVTGTFLYRLLSLIIVHLFHSTYQIEMMFSWPALLLTLGYTVLVYGNAMVRIRRCLKRVEIQELLYTDKRNEATSRETGRKGLRRFFVYLGLLAAGSVGFYLFCFRESVSSHSELIFFVSLAAVLIGTYGIYTTLTCFLTSTLLEHGCLKYMKNQLFILRGITSKLGTIGKTLGTLALLLTLTLTATQMGVLFEKFFSAQSKAVLGFDIAVSNDEGNPDFEDLTRYVKKKYGISYQKQYPLYLLKEEKLYDYCQQYGYIEGTPVLAWSDFRELWSALGYEAVDLEEDRYLLLGSEKIKEKTEETAAPDLRVKGAAELRIQVCRTESFNVGNGFNGAGYAVVIADDLARELPVYHTCLAMETEKPVDAGDTQKLSDLAYGDYQQGVDSFSTNAALEASKTSIVVIFAFSLFYVGLIFACIAATILAIQQLSDAVRYQFRYEVLSKLGMKGHAIERLIAGQTALYFFLPVSLPIPVSIFLSAGLNHYILIDLITTRTFLLAILLSIGLFLFIYCLYFMVTYLGYKRKVTENIE